MMHTRPASGAPVHCLAACAAMLLSAQAPRPAADPTPPATTSSNCPRSANDTERFVSARAFTVDAPTGQLSLVAVRNARTRARGLMCVVRVPRGKGMIFVFPPPEHVQGFWMKDTLVALDMVFVSANGAVGTVAANVPATPAGTPDDRVARRDGLGQFVIELGAGDAARHGIVPGTKLVLPALSAQQ